MSGVEGYVESAASGLLAGVGAAFRARGEEPVAFPEDTALGALGRYIARSDPAHYQPTNIAFGLLPDLAQRVRDKARRRLALSERALASLARFGTRLGGLESAPSPLPALSRV
jgi:methylenetetrahydrofolate--tRNA-(uracil-5-)-methyltransferase